MKDPLVGERAFPRSVWTSDHHGVIAEAYNGGMTLRDYFAGQVLSGWLSSPWVAQEVRDRPDDVARWVFEMADAMLAERAK